MQICFNYQNVACLLVMLTPVYHFKNINGTVMKRLILLLAVLTLAACGKAQTPADPLHAAAVRTCKDTIEGRAVNRNTVDYHSVTVAPAAGPGGKLLATIDFSAKNEIGMATSMQARCVTSADGKALLDIGVTSR